MFNNISKKLKISSLIILVVTVVYAVYQFILSFHSVFGNAQFVPEDASFYVFCDIVAVLITLAAGLVAAFLVYGFAVHLEKQAENNKLLAQIAENSNKSIEK